LYGIKIWTDLSSVLLQFMCLTDGQTDSFLTASPHWHAMQSRKNRSSVSHPEKFGH